METRNGWNLENSYASLPVNFYTKSNPTPVVEPELILYNLSLAKELGFDESSLDRNEDVQCFAGNKIPEGATPISQAYAGHQFGYFTMLGDGRAHLLGEQITPKGERYDIQLKGSGRTAYSRGGDGRAAIGPMLREYIISEAMYGLGIPTTRSLAVVTTGEKVVRETLQKGAILTRVASSHIRVGTFQYIAAWGTKEDIKTLADYTINRHFPNISSSPNPYISLINEVVKTQAELISKWQLVGFIHGVMNTDNMAISGETIDYGPCAFMDAYNPKTVFSSIDVQGRYSYENQPKIAEWNIARFAETLIPLIDKNQDRAIELAEKSVSEFTDQYKANWLNGMRSKLGIFNQEEEDLTLVNELLEIMSVNKLDYTNTFRDLTIGVNDNTNLYKIGSFGEWFDKWNKRLELQEESIEMSKSLMRKSNPSIIPRNHRVEEALEAFVLHEDLSLVNKLVSVLSSPFDYSEVQEEYARLPEKTNSSYKTFCGT